MVMVTVRYEPMTSHGVCGSDGRRAKPDARPNPHLRTSGNAIFDINAIIAIKEIIATRLCSQLGGKQPRQTTYRDTAHLPCRVVARPLAVRMTL
jgi:hypothetical protein